MRTGLEICGAAAGISPEAMAEGTGQVWDLIKAGKLRMDIETVALQDVEHTWQRLDWQSKRVVLIP